MPPKQVYGRRRNVDQSFTRFAWASPVKPATKPIQTITIEERTENIVDGLGKLDLRDSVNQKEANGIEARKPLQSISGNSSPKKNRNASPNVAKSRPSKRDESEVEGLSTSTRRVAIETAEDDEFKSLPSQTSQEEIPVTEASKPRSRQRQTKAPTCAEKSYLSPLLDISNDPIARQGPTDFAAYVEALAQHFNIAKIAEASYGEVYRLALKSSIPGFAASDESVLKILPLKPPPHVTRVSNIDMMSEVENVASEVCLLQRMTDIPGFTNFREVRVLQGRPPSAIVKAWKAFNKAQPKDQKSLFPDPSRKTSYREKQLWAVIEMQDAGTDLEHVKLNDVWSVWDVFWGAALTLAKGEEAARFEHRDFHLGNICVLSTRRDPDDTDKKIQLKNRKLGFTALQVTVIDYTLSRAELSDPQDEEQEPRVAYLDLDKDQYLFEADSSEEYQYEIYRYMRSAVFLDDPLANFKKRRREVARSGRTWMGYHPQSNVVWLHFVLHELMKHLESVGEVQDGATQFDTDDPDAVNQNRALLLTLLRKIAKMLDPKRFRKSELHSAGDLVALALSEKWLDETDVLNGAAI